MITVFPAIVILSMLSLWVFATAPVSPEEVEKKTNEIISSIHENFSNATDSETLVYKAKAFEHYNKLVDSFYYYNQALTLDSYNEEAKFGKDYIYNKIKNSVSQILESENILANESNSLDALTTKGQMSLSLEQYDDAYKFCSKAAKIEQSLQVNQCAFDALLELHHYREAQDFSNTWTISSSDVIVWKMIPMYQLGEYDDLISSIDAALSQYPTGMINLQFQITKAMVLEKMHKQNEANIIYQTLISSVDQSLIDRIKATMYFTFRDYDRAIYYISPSPGMDDQIGYMKVMAYDEIEKSETNSFFHQSSNAGFFEIIVQFFRNLFHWQ